MKQIRALTSLRFVAAMMVVLCHLDILAENTSPWLSGLYNKWFSEGFIGVTFFFVLSGFILSHANWGAGAGPAEVSRRRFYVNRFARIYPLHALTFVLALPLVWTTLHHLSTTELWLGLLTNAALLQAFVPIKNVYLSVNHPSWSLSVEFFFYALFPLLLAWRTRALLALLAAGCVGHVLLALHADADAVARHWQYLAYVAPPVRLVDFVAGMLLYRLRRHLVLSDGRATLLQGSALMVLFMQMAAAPHVSMILRSDLYYLPVMTVLVYAFSFDNGILGRALTGARAVYLGEISFSLYMVHQLVIRYGEHLLAKLKVVETLTNGLVFVALVMAISLLASMLLYQRVELPAKSWLSRRLRPA